MIFYIKLMTCIILTCIAIIILRVLFDAPIYRLKHSLKKQSFRNKINMGLFKNEELLIIKDEVEKALEIDSYINKDRKE